MIIKKGNKRKKGNTKVKNDEGKMKCRIKTKLSAKV